MDAERGETSAPHLTWTDEPYRAGEATNIELSGCRHRYTAALARTVVLGEPPPEHDGDGPGRRSRV